MVCFFMLSEEFRQLLSSHEHPSCGKRPHVHPFLWNQRYCEAQLNFAETWNTKIDDPPLSWLTWIPVTPKSSTALALGVWSILFSRAQAQPTPKQVNHSERIASCMLPLIGTGVDEQSHIPYLSYNHSTLLTR